MKNTFTKQELLTGDIVELRNGQVGMVIAEQEVIHYTEGGYDYFDTFNNDLTSMDDEIDFDIVAIYRGEKGSTIGFIDYKDEEPIYERFDENASINNLTVFMEKSAISECLKSKNNDLITILSQAFYGNRTVTEIKTNEIDSFILGYLDANLMSKDERIDRTLIHLPDSDELVIIYNRFAEEEQLLRNAKYLEEDGYVAKPLAIIPELNVKLYSRCIACRINELGQLESLQERDFTKIIKYF